MSFKFAAVAAAAMFAVSAQAATVTFSYNLPIVQTPTELINITGNLGRFNAALGTLTGAVLNIFNAATTTITLQSKPATVGDISGRATASVDVLWSSPVALLDAVLIDDGALAFTTGGSMTYTPGQSRTFGPLTDSGTFSYSLSAPVRAALTGAGTFALVCNTASGLNVIGGGGNFNSTQTTTAGCGASITYSYESAVIVPGIPEPTSLALIALALLGAGAATRRKA